jgi:hypothetical protein
MTTVMEEHHPITITPPKSLRAPAQSFRQTAPMKPPAKVDGFLQFVKDAPGHFSLDEQRAFSTSEAGIVLAQSIVRCEGYSKQLKDVRKKLVLAASEDTHTKKEITEQKRNAFIAKVKYVECLAYMTCPERWKQYTRCWQDTVGNLSPAEIQSWREHGALEVVCRTERESLERGVGDVVSSAVQAADSSPRVYDDLFPSQSEIPHI